MVSLIISKGENNFVLPFKTTSPVKLTLLVKSESPVKLVFPLNVISSFPKLSKRSFILLILWSIEFKLMSLILFTLLVNNFICSLVKLLLNSGT